MGVLIVLGTLWLLRRRAPVGASAPTVPIPVPVSVPIEEAPTLSPTPAPVARPTPILAVGDVAQCVSCGNVVRRFEVLDRDFAHFGPDGLQEWFYLVHELGPDPVQPADFWVRERNQAGQEIERAISPRVEFSNSTIIAYLEHIGFMTSQAAIDSVRAQLQPDSGNQEFQPGGRAYETLFSIRGIFTVGVGQARRHVLGSIRRRAA